MTPQEKKRLSLKNDCRNTYGENDKSSRKSIRFRKRWVNRSFRRSTRQVLNTDSPNEAAEDAAAVARKHWKKSSDTPLGELLMRDRNQALEYHICKAASCDPDFFDSLSSFLEGKKIHPARHCVLMRRSRAVAMDRHSSSLDFDSNDIALIEQFIHRYQFA